MSVTSAGGMGGGSDGGGDDKKRKMGLPADKVDDPLASSDYERGHLGDDEGGGRDDDDDTNGKSDIDHVANSDDDNLQRIISNDDIGISRHYRGKSKSYENLTDLDTDESKDLGKVEHPVNKKRRLEITEERRKQSQSGASGSHADQPMPDFIDDDDDGNGGDDEAEKTDDSMNQEDTE